MADQQAKLRNRLSVKKFGQGLPGLSEVSGVNQKVEMTAALNGLLIAAIKVSGAVKINVQGDALVGKAVRTQGLESWGEKLDELKNNVKDDEATYFVLFRSALDCLIVTYVPDNAKPKTKMLYASSKDSLKDALMEFDDKMQLEEFNVAELSDLTYSSYEKKVNAPKPYSEQELLRKEQEKQETAGGYGVLARIMAAGEGNPLTNRDVLSGDAHATPMALPGLSGGAGLSVLKGVQLKPINSNKVKPLAEKKTSPLEPTKTPSKPSEINKVPKKSSFDAIDAKVLATTNSTNKTPKKSFEVVESPKKSIDPEPEKVELVQAEPVEKVDEDIDDLINGTNEDIIIKHAKDTEPEVVYESHDVEEEVEVEADLIPSAPGFPHDANSPEVEENDDEPGPQPVDGNFSENKSNVATFTPTILSDEENDSAIAANAKKLPPNDAPQLRGLVTKEGHAVVLTRNTAEKLGFFGRLSRLFRSSKSKPQKLTPGEIEQLPDSDGKCTINELREAKNTGNFNDLNPSMLESYLSSREFAQLTSYSKNTFYKLKTVPTKKDKKAAGNFIDLIMKFHT